MRDSQVPLIPLLVKTTGKVNFIKPFTVSVGIHKKCCYSSLQDFITNHYYEDAGKYQEALYEFSEMRLVR